jgi:hypothetical protein
MSGGNEENMLDLAVLKVSLLLVRRGRGYAKE